MSGDMGSRARDVALPSRRALATTRLFSSSFPGSANFLRSPHMTPWLVAALASACSLCLLLAAVVVCLAFAGCCCCRCRAAWRWRLGACCLCLCAVFPPADPHGLFHCDCAAPPTYPRCLLLVAVVVCPWCCCCSPRRAASASAYALSSPYPLRRPACSVSAVVCLCLCHCHCPLQCLVRCVCLVGWVCPLLACACARRCCLVGAS